MATLKLKAKATLADVETFMLKATDIVDWNDRRDVVKQQKDDKWIAVNIDATRMIKKANLQPLSDLEEVEQEIEVKLTPEEKRTQRLDKLTGGNDKLRDFYKQQIH